MIRTRVGYAGGSKAAPTYTSLGDHTEAVQVDFDPQRISYEELLRIFWESHAPDQRTWSRQYMNAIFFHDDHQRRLALAAKEEVEQTAGGKVRTEILPVRSFTLAEDYHQKYMLKRRQTLKAELARFFPRHAEFVDSTAVSRLNGYVGGYGTPAQLQREIDLLGLSAEGKRLLRNMAPR